MSDIAFRPAAELAAGIRTGEIGSRELLEHYLERVERYNPALNAIVTLAVEQARRRADAADAARARGELWGPLHGLPMTIKDTFETAGILSTSGNPEFAERVPELDSPSVARLVAAGAVVFGKTNTPINGSDVQTYNDIFGTTNSPWDLERAPGGSSGGTAAALAAGLSALDIGSDIGGSIRNPAHYCGVYGHKPTFGIVPRKRLRPPGMMSVGDLTVAGPLGRSIEDVALELEVIAGPESDRALAWRLELPPPRRASLRGYRVAAWLDDEAYPVDGAVLERLRATVEALRSAGVEVDEEARPDFDMREAVRVYRSLLAATGARGLVGDRWSAPASEEDGLPPESGVFEQPSTDRQRSAALRHRDWLHLNEVREQLRWRWEQLFERYDVLLCPVTQVTALRHDQRPIDERRIIVNGAERPYWDQLSWVGIVTMAYLPATVAPVGRTAEGLPVGIQVVGPHLEDRTPIDFARRLGEVIGGYEPPPGYG